ncbi:MAG: hypothetical protein FWF67_05315 [Fibromonadales bacterium]|nr:hypothetical protein [Fibromonadales bacterium]
MYLKLLGIFAAVALLILFACSDDSDNPTWPFERTVSGVSIAKRPSHYLLMWQHPIERAGLQNYYVWIDTTVVRDSDQSVSQAQISQASKVIPYGGVGDGDSLELTAFLTSEFLERDSLHIAIWAWYSGKEQGVVQHKYIYFGDDMSPSVVNFSDSSSSNSIWIDWMRPNDQRDFYAPEIANGPIAGYNITVQARNSNEDIRNAGLEISLDGRIISANYIRKFQRFRKKGRETVLEGVANTESKLLRFAIIDGKGFDIDSLQANNWRMRISGLLDTASYRVLVVAYDSAGNSSGPEEIENGTYIKTTDAIPPLIANKFRLYRDPGDKLARLDSNRLVLFWPRSVDPLTNPTQIKIDSMLHIPASCSPNSCYREVRGYLIEQKDGNSWKVISDIKDSYTRHSLQNDSMVAKSDGDFVSDTLRWISPGDTVILRMRAVDNSGAYSKAWTDTIFVSKGELWQYKCPPNFAPVKNNSDVFCMERLQHISKDTFEVNVLHKEAKERCEALGNHLCTEEEWNAACTSGGSLYGVVEERVFEISDFLSAYCGVGTGNSVSAKDPEKRNRICASPDGIRDLPGQLQEWVVGKDSSGREIPLLKGSSYAIFEGALKAELAQCKNKFTPTRIRPRYTANYDSLPPDRFKDTLLFYTLWKNNTFLGEDYVDQTEFRRRGDSTGLLLNGERIKWLDELWKGLEYKKKEPGNEYRKPVMILGTESINAGNFFLDPTVGFRCCTGSK